MKESVRKEVEELIEKLDLDCSIREFQDKVNWENISHKQKLSLDLIREFKDKIIFVLQKSNTNVSYL